MDDQVSVCGDEPRRRLPAVLICENNKLFLTPFWEWHNERAIGLVPEPRIVSGELTNSMHVAGIQPDDFLEDYQPLRTKTCGWGRRKALYICIPSPRGCDH